MTIFVLSGATHMQGILDIMRPQVFSTLDALRTHLIRFVYNDEGTTTSELRSLIERDLPWINADKSWGSSGESSYLRIDALDVSVSCYMTLPLSPSDA